MNYIISLIETGARIAFEAKEKILITGVRLKRRGD
jgi:hypothetical protein